MGVVVLRGASDKRSYADGGASDKRSYADGGVGDKRSYADGGVMCGGMITIYSAKRIGTERAEFVSAA